MMYWLDLLAVQGTLKSLLQYHSSIALILQCLTIFTVQFSYPYMTTRKTMALTRRIFVSTVSTFSHAVWVCHSFSSMEKVTFNFMAAVTICSDFGAQENKVSQCFHCFLIYLPWSDGTACHDLNFLNAEFYASFFTLLFHFHQQTLKFLLAFYHKGVVICISEVIDISPGNVDSSLCFIQPGISHDVLCI